MAGVVCPHCQRETRVYRDMGYEGFTRKCGLCNKVLPEDAPKVSPKPAPVRDPVPATVAWIPTAEEQRKMHSRSIKCGHIFRTMSTGV
jgi:hypothetical protein